MRLVIVWWVGGINWGLLALAGRRRPILSVFTGVRHAMGPFVSPPLYFGFGL
jgi:hypothetical protein